MLYKVAILIQRTLDWQEIADITVKNNEEYARKHGYSFIHEIFDSPYDGFNKIETVQKLFLFTDVTLVWSLDCDALITRHSIKIENFVDNEHDFYITKDYNGLNAGSFIIKKSQWSYSFISYLLDQKGKDGMYCEQDAINQYRRTYPESTKIKILPQSNINSYLYENYPEIPLQTHEQGNWDPGDFVLHLPGVGMKKRIEILKNTPISK